MLLRVNSLYYHDRTSYQMLTEAQLADELAKAKIPVILSPWRCLPRTFETRNWYDIPFNNL